MWRINCTHHTDASSVCGSVPCQCLPELVAMPCASTHRPWLRAQQSDITSIPERPCYRHCRAACHTAHCHLHHCASRCYCMERCKATHWGRQWPSAAFAPSPPLHRLSTASPPPPPSPLHP